MFGDLLSRTTSGWQRQFRNIAVHCHGTGQSSSATTKNYLALNINSGDCWGLHYSGGVGWGMGSVGTGLKETLPNYYQGIKDDYLYRLSWLKLILLSLVDTSWETRRTPIRSRNS